MIHIDRGRALLYFVGVGCIGLAGLAGFALTYPSAGHLAILVSASAPLVAIALLSPRHLILILAVWLALLGLVRRLLVDPGSRFLLGDPLLLVEPAIIVLLLLAPRVHATIPQRSRLANAVLIACGLCLLGALNPLQGGLTVGIGGLLLVLVPILAFWIGRAILDDRTLTRLFIAIATIALPLAAYGLIQTGVGFPAWDQRWIHTVTANGTYVALSVNGVIRAFSSFSSSAEYATFLAVGIAVWFSFDRRPIYLPITVCAVALLAAAIFLDSSRGVVVLAVIALGIMWAARAGVTLRWAGLVGLVCLILLQLSVSQLAPQSRSASGTSALLGHQIVGLAHPFSAKDSTVSIHLNEITHGIRSGFTHPVGFGTGAITLAASKFGTGTAQGTESDPSNAAVAFGLPGLITYLIIAILGLSQAYRLAAMRRDFLTTAVLGILVVTFLQWLNGGQYAVAWLPWLALGWIDHALGNLSHNSSGNDALDDGPLPLFDKRDSFRVANPKV